MDERTEFAEHLRGKVVPALFAAHEARNAELLAEIERLRAKGCSALLGAAHTGMRISASGILGRIRDGRYCRELNYGCGVMLDHLEQMASRFYAGDATAVDEFLQLYCLDSARPQTPNEPVQPASCRGTNDEQ